MKRILITILCVLGVAWSIANTQAATIGLDFDRTNADYLVGTVTPVVPTNVAAQTLSLNQLLSMTGGTSAVATITGITTPTTTYTFNRTDLSAGNFPAPNGLTATLTNTTSGPLLPVDSNQYVIANFGSETAYWFVGNLTTADQIQVPTTMDQNNISSITTMATPIGNIAVNPVGATTGIVTGATNVPPSGTTTATTAGTIAATTTGTTVTPVVTTTGNITGATPATIAATAPTGAAKVPEPGTILLLGLGFLSLAGLRRKFQKC